MNRMIALGCAGLLGFSASVSAASAGTVTYVSERVSLKDLDLSTPDGAKAMIRRVDRVSERLCAEALTPLLPRSSAQIARCRTKVLARAVAMVNAPMVTREYALTHPDADIQLAAVAETVR